MQPTAFSPIRRSTDHADLPPFRVVALHESYQSGVRAQEALVWLEHVLGEGLDVQSSCWSFRSLERLDLRAVSIREGTAADVIIVAAAEADVLPDQVKRWLETCLRSQRGEHALLIALHEDGPEEQAAPAALCGYLQPLARRWHTAFMCNDELDSRLNCGFALEKLHRKYGSQPLPNEPSGFDAYSVGNHGGINE